MSLRILLLLLLLLPMACGDADEPPVDSGTVRTDTIGDTITVRSGRVGVWPGTATLEPRLTIGTLDGAPATVFGRIAAIDVGPEGNLHVLDRQALEVRVFDPSGAFIRTIGRQGEGPGELAQPGAMAVFPDGRVAAQDPRNARLQVWSADGSETAEWPVVSNRLYTSMPLWIDGDGRSWVYTSGLSTDPTRPSPRVVVRVASDGSVLDTIPDPADYAERPLVTVTAPGRGTISSSSTLPYFPGGSWAVHPSGQLLRTTRDGAGVEMLLEDGSVRRYIRNADAVEVPAEERAQVRASIAARMRDTDPNWNWNGPEIPESKPHASRVFAARDGRVWVTIATPSREVENPYHDPEFSGSTPTMWTESIAFDVFEPDGTYLGRVEPDDDFSTRPMPAFTAEGVWAVTRDDLGVERIVWYELEVPEEGP